MDNQSLSHVKWKCQYHIYNYTDCANCMACIQACPTKALQFATVKEPNPNARYRNPHIILNEIIAANRQS